MENKIINIATVAAIAKALQELKDQMIFVGEANTPIRPSVCWLDGSHEVHDIYENAVPQLFVPNILSFATEGKELYYGAIRTQEGDLGWQMQGIAQCFFVWFNRNTSK